MSEQLLWKKKMSKQFKTLRQLLILVLGLVFLFGTTSVWAANSLPQPNEKGDYVSKSDHLYWQVVDPDPNGLNCRMGEAPIEAIWSPDNPGFPAIGSWPAVTTLKPDEVFKAQLSYSGFVATFDQELQPWIFIKKKQDGTPANCFVRANQTLIKPIEELAQNVVEKPTETVEQPPETVESVPETVIEEPDIFVDL